MFNYLEWCPNADFHVTPLFDAVFDAECPKIYKPHDIETYLLVQWDTNKDFHMSYTGGVISNDLEWSWVT